MQPSATPGATFTPIALISELVIASGVDASGAPSDDLEQISRTAPSVVLAARLTNLSAGETLEAQWLNENGDLISASEQAAQPTGGPQWVTFSLQLGGALPPGTYAAAIRINGQLLDSIVFRLT